MKKALVILLIMGLSAFIPFLNVSANFPENFDTYSAGTLNPGLWKFQTNSTSCFPNSGGGSAKVYNIGVPASPPNDYLINTNANAGASCAAHEYGQLTQQFNSSFYATSVTAFVHDATFASTPAAGQFNFVLNLTSYNGNSPYATTTTNFTDVHSITSAYKKFISTVPSVPGSNVTVSIQFATGTAPTFPLGSPTAWEVDNVSISGANQIITGHNFDMVNSSSLQWFSISSYAGSRVILNYTGGASNTSAQWAPNGVLVPDITYANLATGHLITVYVGNIYSRSLIPSAHTHMYLDNPASVIAYTITVLGPPDVYGPKSTIYIQQGNHNISSGYLDSSATYAAALIPGSYVVRVTSQDGSTVQIQTLNFPATSAQVTFNAYANIVVTNPSGVVSAIEWDAGWNSTNTGIVVNYIDHLNTTTAIGISIRRVNGSGSFQVFSHIYSGLANLGTFTVTIPATSQMNYTFSNQLIVFLNATNHFGTFFNMGSQALACFGCLLNGGTQTSNPNLPNSVLGLGILPGITVLNLIAMLIMVSSAGAFGIYWSRFGFFIVASEAIFFVFAGWLSFNGAIALSESIALIFVVLAFTGLMVFHERT